MGPKQKALDKQAVIEAERDRKNKDEQDRREAEEWAVGAKDSSKSKSAEDKEAAKRQKAQEMAALLAADAAATDAIVNKVKKPKKAKGKDDFDMLNAALASQPKTKAQKEADAKKAADEQRKIDEEAARAAKAARLQAEQDRIAKAAARGIIINHTDELMVPINNRLEEDDFEGASGLDAAIDVLGGAVSKGAKIEDRPEKKNKALYEAFYTAALPNMKSQHPGLKLSQYKERIFELWKSAPDNPRNQSGGGGGGTLGGSYRKGDELLANDDDEEEEEEA